MKSLYSQDESKNLGGSGTILDNSGRNGITPHIGPGNHWFIGNYDTGVSAGTADASIDVDKRTVTIDGKTLTIPEKVNISELASKDDLKDLVKEAELSEYAKVADLSSVTVKRNRPTTFRAEISNPADHYIIFDNGAEMHFVPYSALNLAFGANGGYSISDNPVMVPIVNNIYSYLAGKFSWDAFKKLGAGEFVNWSYSIKNPLYSVDAYNWSAVKITDDAPIATQSQLNWLKSWYAVGLFTDDIIEHYGAVKKVN